ncbi:MAG: dTMP kinase [Desulfatibacillum sp.]|nr:dTMP kinase [Desulfatibacillum sp.]
MSRPGIFITLEGIEGAGKTTQVRRIVEFMESQGFECIATREPGGTDIGAKIRAILLNSEHITLAPMAELLLYEADRAQHLARLVKPALETGKCVICDRFCDATTAYQGHARGLSLDFINGLHAQILEGLAPDLTLLFDLPAEIGLTRARARLDAQNSTGLEGRFEAEELAFHQKVRKGYLSLAKDAPGRFAIVDAEAPPDQVWDQTKDLLARFLAQRSAA